MSSVFFVASPYLPFFSLSQKIKRVLLDSGHHQKQDRGLCKIVAKFKLEVSEFSVRLYLITEA